MLNSSVSFNGLDEDDLKHILNDREIVLGERTKNRIKEEYENNSGYLNRVSLKKVNEYSTIMPEDLLPKSSNDIFSKNFPKMERVLVPDRLPTLDEKKEEVIVERPDFTDNNWGLDKDKKEMIDNTGEMFSFESTKIEKLPKSILKKPEKPKQIVKPNEEKVVVKKEEIINKLRIFEILKKYNISISLEDLEEKLRRLNISSMTKIPLLISEVVREYKPKKIDRQIEPIRVFNEKDYYREKIRIGISSEERDKVKFSEPNNFEVNLPNNGLSNVCNVRLISLIMPKNIEEKLDDLPFMIVDIREIGQNFVMNNGKIGGFCQIIFDKENMNYKMSYPDISIANKDLSPIRNINKLTIRLLNHNGELIKFGSNEIDNDLENSFNVGIVENIKLEIDKPKISGLEYNPDPSVEIKKLEELKETTDTIKIEKNILNSDSYPPVSLLFEFTYLKNRSLMT